MRRVAAGGLHGAGGKGVFRGNCMTRGHEYIIPLRINKHDPNPMRPHSPPFPTSHTEQTYDQTWTLSSLSSICYELTPK